MTLGKPLRLRRIFSSGRALAVDFTTLHEDVLPKLRIAARAGADALVLTPGLLALAAEELGALAVIMKLDGGCRFPRQLLSVETALEMGAEAVLLSVEARPGTVLGELDRFARVASDCTKFGVPLLAEMIGDDWLETARLCAGYGADVVQVPFLPSHFSYRNFVRTDGCPTLLSLPGNGLPVPEFLAVVNEAMEGPAQGLVLGEDFFRIPEAAALLHAVSALVHQGIRVEQAIEIVFPPPPEVEQGNES
jgi:2-amino-4,5-dihydroxy-6-oxo-7-(phosphooxy)heptanoate synthase